MPLATKASRSSKLSTSGRGEAGAAVAEVLEHHLLEGDTVGHPLEGEGLDDQLGGAHLVEAAVEAVLVSVTRVHVAIGPSRTAVEVVDPHLVAARPEPLLQELGVGVGPEHLCGRSTP